MRWNYAAANPKVIVFSAKNYKNSKTSLLMFCANMIAKL